jgi:PAS domain S-box-containing protein
MLESPDLTEPPLEEQFVRTDGTVIDVEVMATATQYEGKPAVMVVFRDITERKKMETALLENEKNYRDLYDNAPNAYYTVSPHGMITQCNYRAGEILGVPSTGLIGKKIADFYANTPAGKEKARRLFGAFRHGKEILQEELQMQRADGSLIWIHLTVNAIRNSSGTITGSRTIITDISSRKLAEDALRVASDKLQLLSGITRHDIRNQILTIRGAVALIESDGQDQKLKKCTGIAKKALDAIASQIEFTKEYGTLGTKEPRWQNAGEVFSAATRHFLMQDIALTLPDTGYEIFADLLLEKAFYNLIDNALRHGGEVTAIGLSFRETTEGLSVVVGDNGRGVTDADKELIFRKGFGKNTGLGLFFVREILAITGITIKESGEPEKGARFEILVPKGLFRPVAP